MFERIREMARDRAVILISHRFSTVYQADRIYIIGKGRVVESGAHASSWRSTACTGVCTRCRPAPTRPSASAGVRNLAERRHALMRRVRQNWQRFRLPRAVEAPYTSSVRLGGYYAAPKAHVRRRLSRRSSASSAVLAGGRPRRLRPGPCSGYRALGPGPQRERRTPPPRSTFWPPSSMRRCCASTCAGACSSRNAASLRPDLPGPARPDLPHRCRRRAQGHRHLVRHAEWASDRTLWRYVPPGYHAGVSHSFYPPAANRLIDFQAFATSSRPPSGRRAGLRMPQRAQPWRSPVSAALAL